MKFFPYKINVILRKNRDFKGSLTQFLISISHYEIECNKGESVYLHFEMYSIDLLGLFHLAIRKSRKQKYCIIFRDTVYDDFIMQIPARVSTSNLTQLLFRFTLLALSDTASMRSFHQAPSSLV